MIQKANRAHEQRGGAFRLILGVSSFLFAGIGGVECGESTGAGADNRSIWEWYTDVFSHVLRGKRNRGHEERKPICVELCPILYI